MKSYEFHKIVTKNDWSPIGKVAATFFTKKATENILFLTTGEKRWG